METASLTAAVVGAVELVNRLFNRDYKASAKIAVAALVGALLAPYAVADMTWFAGLVLGLGASGVITALTRVGGSK